MIGFKFRPNMLRLLRVRNLAVIESVDVTFEPGFNVLTGETGAGKSILVDALMLVLGRGHGGKCVIDAAGGILGHDFAGISGVVRAHGRAGTRRDPFAANEALIGTHDTTEARSGRGSRVNTAAVRQRTIAASRRLRSTSALKK